MKQILLILFVMVGYGLTAQVTFAPDQPNGTGNTGDSDIKVDVDITNDTNAEQSTFWTIDRVSSSEPVPEEWEFQICDKNNCYIWGLEQCPASSPAVFSSNETFTYNLHMNPHGVEGVGNIAFNITSEDGTILSSIPVDYQIDLVSGLSETDFDVKQIKLYPNPTTDYIQITNDNSVNKVAFYNIVGKRLNTSVHYSGKSHDVSSLQKGIYLVRLFDENDNVISVIKVNKKGLHSFEAPFFMRFPHSRNCPIKFQFDQYFPSHKRQLSPILEYNSVYV